MQRIGPEDLRLLLKVDGEYFIKGESISLEVELLNTSSGPIKVEELTLNNNPLNFYAINSLGERFSGSLLTPIIKDGFAPPPVREKFMILLQPKIRRTIKADLLNILGELTDGDYKVVATYSSENILSVWSNNIFIKVLKSVPVYSKTLLDYFRANSNPIRTTCINREKDGLQLFIMESSQYLPLNTRSNRRLLQIDGNLKVIPSILASPTQEAEHLIWIEAETVKVASIHQRVLKDLRAIRLPMSNFQILEPPFTDTNGTLYFLVVSKQRNITNFQLISYSFDDNIKTEDILRFNGDFSKYCVFFDSGPKLHMTWASKSGEIFYTWLDLEESTRAKVTPQMLVKGKPPILDLQLSKTSEDEEGRLRLLLNFVNCESADKLHAQLVNAQTGNTVLHSFHSLPELEDLTLLQTILDLECKPHFLFQDRKGALWLKSSEAATPTRVTEEGETYPGNIEYPTLLVSSNLTRHYGIYLRYIEDKSRFVYKKLESLR